MPLLRVLSPLVVAAFVAVPALAQDDIGFAPVKQHEIVVAPFTDAQVASLLTTLDTMVAKQKDPAKWAKDADIHFWRLTNRFQTGKLSAEQLDKVLVHFNGIEAAHPADKAFMDKQRQIVRTRMIGQVAPDIVGKDLDDVEFKLSDLRGKVVVLYFTGEWCGPCRGEYPYQRLMLEVHKGKPFAIVGVNSDSKLDVAKKSKVDNRLEYRSWWDGYVEKKSTEGPIADAWNITGWPTIYILDTTGVIRFVNLRNEDILKGVSQLLRELPPQK